jgi:hypothetical protein
MSPGVAELAALLAHVDRTREALRQHRAELEPYVRGFDPRAPAPAELALIAVQMSAWYNALEDLFQGVMRAFDESPGAGESWHVELLKRAATALPHVRPAVVDGVLEPELRRILRFRHFLRHAYAVRLDWTKMSAVAEALLASHDRVVTSLDAFGVAIDAAVTGRQDGR